MALPTAATLVTHLRLPPQDATQLDHLTMLIGAAAAALETYLRRAIDDGRAFEGTAYDAPDVAWPIVTSLRSGGGAGLTVPAAASTAVTVVVDDLWGRADWASRVKPILDYAVLEMAARFAQNRNADAIAEGETSLSVTMAERPIPERIRAMIDEFRAPA